MNMVNNLFKTIVLLLVISGINACSMPQEQEKTKPSTTFLEQERSTF